MDGRPKEFIQATVNGTSKTRNVVRGLDLHEEIILSGVWAVDVLVLPRGDAPTKEDIERWSRLKGINFPRIQSDKLSVFIGCDVPEAH